MRSVTAFALMAAIATPQVLAQSVPAAPAADGVFTLAALPYAADALEPVIDAETMTLHHGKHHQAYVDALNKAVFVDAKLTRFSLEALLAKAGSLPSAVRNNGGGHWNHSFFWSIMAPPGAGGIPSPELARAIDAQFGSMEAMKTAFKAAGTGRFGSGWAWLVVTRQGQLAITSTPNQDNPLMDVAELQGTPILGNDLWEHAYYLKHRNRRADYLDRWWQVVNWREVSRRYADATARR
jgi:superoxide dismutase, Fe-Mn family